jgi:hypothetical protein
MMTTQTLNRHRVRPEQVRIGDVLVTMPGSPRIRNVRTTRKGNVEVYIGKGKPITLAINTEHVWVGR